MRVIKPNYVTPLPAPYDDGRRLHCVVTAIFHATFAGELCEERLLWPYVNEDVEGMVLDEAMPKAEAEWLVHGSCWARGPDVRQSFVKARLGDQEKTLAVFGKRTFKLGVASDPEPFESVPIRWSNAFGGEGFAENPTGKGYRGGELPQVELLSHLMRAPSDRPPVAGFGRVDVTLPQRLKKLGTYDGRWLKTRYPGMAEDIDMTYFQLAQADQRRQEFFRGDETFSLVNLHPEQAQLDGKLPGVVARFFVKRAGEEMVDVPMHIDTVHLFPGRERQVIVCRGGTLTRSDTLDDIEEIGVGLEWLGRPKPREHYAAIFAARRSKKGGALAALDDSGLLPEQPPKKKERLVPPGEGLFQRQMERRLEHQHAELKAQLVDNGLDLKYLLPLPKLDMSADPDDLPPFPDEPPTVEGVKAEVAAKRAEMVAQARREIDEATADLPEEDAAKMCARLEAAIAETEKEPVGPPTLTRDRFRAQLEEQIPVLEEAGVDTAAIQSQLDDEATDRRMRELDAMVCETYRTTVQHQGVPPSLDAEANVVARAAAQIRFDAAEPFERLDLTGADLSGMDLHGANLRGAWLEATNLTGVKLDEANLERAVLARAKLAGADLRQCKLAGANLSGADLTGADLRGCDLTGCFLVRADLTDTRLDGATLLDVDLEGAKLVRTDLSRTTVKNTLLMGLAFDGAKLVETRWEKATLHQCSFKDVDARRASWSLVLLVDASFERVRLDDAKLFKLQVCKIDTVPRLVACSFVGATLELCLFRGVVLEGCDFSHSIFDKSDFSKAKADGSIFTDAHGVGARFVGASVRDCRFDRADLMSAFFGSAMMDRASFTDANLCRADFGRSGGEAVDMSGANVKRVRTVPKREETS